MTGADPFYVAPVVLKPVSTDVLCAGWRGACRSPVPQRVVGTTVCLMAECTMSECCEPKTEAPPAGMCGATATCDQGDKTAKKPATSACAATVCTPDECCQTTAEKSAFDGAQKVCGATFRCPSAFPTVLAENKCGSTTTCRPDECCEPAIEAAPAGTCGTSTGGAF